MIKVKGFSYHVEKDKDVIDYIKTKPNGSRYIKDLIRKDMSKDSIEEIVKKEIEKYLKGKNIADKKVVANVDTQNIMDILSM